jgi:hypothetical protein
MSAITSPRSLHRIDESPVMSSLTFRSVSAQRRDLAAVITPTRPGNTTSSATHTPPPMGAPSAPLSPVLRLPAPWAWRFARPPQRPHMPAADATTNTARTVGTRRQHRQITRRFTPPGHPARCLTKSWGPFRSARRRLPGDHPLCMRNHADAIAGLCADTIGT